MSGTSGLATMPVWGLSTDKALTAGNPIFRFNVDSIFFAGVRLDMIRKEPTNEQR